MKTATARPLFRVVRDGRPLKVSHTEAEVLHILARIGPGSGSDVAAASGERISAGAALVTLERLETRRRLVQRCPHPSDAHRLAWSVTSDTRVVRI